jgi:hypothetical protein
MKKLGGVAKGAAKGVAKEAFSATLQAAVKEIIVETGAKDLAKEQLLDAGKKVLGDKTVPSKQKMQKDILKSLIKKELGL